MRTRMSAVLVVLLLAQATASAAQEEGLIVTYKTKGRAVMVGADGMVVPEAPTLVPVPEGETLDDALQRLVDDPEVEFVEPNFMVYATRVLNPKPGGGGQTPGTKNPNPGQLLSGETASWGRDRVQAPAAWELLAPPPLEKRPLVCVIDSGIDCRHPDLGPACGPAFNMITGKSGVAEAMDDNGHGTQIAGAIAAQMNGQGVVGIAPQATLLSCKFMDSTGAGSTYNANACLQWCMRNGATVSVNAWGADNPKIADYTTTLQRTLQNRPDHLFITSAGNAGNSLQPDSWYSFYPAMLNLKNMLVVAATNQGDELGTWPGGGSNYGAPIVQIGAPGVDIVTTDRCINPDPAAWYRIVSGSSIATGLVGGGAALLLAAKPYATSNDLKRWLLDGANRIPALTSSIESGRRLNVFNSVSTAQGSFQPSNPLPFSPPLSLSPSLQQPPVWSQPVRQKSPPPKRGGRRFGAADDPTKRR